jgi:hypothetical protein
MAVTQGTLTPTVPTDHAEPHGQGEGGRHATGAGTHGEHTPPGAVDGSADPP